MSQVWSVLASTCPSRSSLARIANKWTAMIVTVLNEQPRRFKDIRASLDGISGKSSPTRCETSNETA